MPFGRYDDAVLAHAREHWGINPSGCVSTCWDKKVNFPRLQEIKVYFQRNPPITHSTLQRLISPQCCLDLYVFSPLHNKFTETRNHKPRQKQKGKQPGCPRTTAVNVFLLFLSVFGMMKLRQTCETVSWSMCHYYFNQTEFFNQSFTVKVAGQATQLTKASFWNIKMDDGEKRQDKGKKQWSDHQRKTDSSKTNRERRGRRYRNPGSKRFLPRGASEHEYSQVP